MNDKVTDWVRQVVPTLWAALVAVLVSKNAPEWLTTVMQGMTYEVVVPVVLGATYGVLVKVEPHLPAWLRAVLMGSSKLPTYDDVKGKHAL